MISRANLLLTGPLFGLPGLLFASLLGAVLRQLAAGSSILRSTNVGVNTKLDLRYDRQTRLQDFRTRS
jgi:hypothetical protein